MHVIVYCQRVLLNGNGNVVTLIAKSTAPKPKPLQHLYKQTVTT